VGFHPTLRFCNNCHCEPLSCGEAIPNRISVASFLGDCFRTTSVLRNDRMLIEGDGVFWRFLNEGKSLWVFIPPYDSAIKSPGLTLTVQHVGSMADQSAPE